MTALTVTDAGNLVRELNAQYQPKGVCAATPAKMRLLLNRLQEYTEEVQRARNKYKALGVASIALGPAGVAVGELLGGGDVDVAQWRTDMTNWQYRLAAYQRVIDGVAASEMDTPAGCSEIYPLVTAPLLDGIYYDIMPGILLSKEERRRIQDGARHCPEGEETCVDIAYRDPATGDHPPGHSNPKIPDAITPFSLGNQIIVYQDFQKELLRQLIEDLKRPFQPSGWPWWVKALLIGGAGVAVGVAGLYVARLFPRETKRNPSRKGPKKAIRSRAQAATSTAEIGADLSAGAEQTLAHARRVFANARPSIDPVTGEERPVMFAVQTTKHPESVHELVKAGYLEPAPGASMWGFYVKGERLLEEAEMF